MTSLKKIKQRHRHSFQMNNIIPEEKLQRYLVSCVVPYHIWVDKVYITDIAGKIQSVGLLTHKEKNKTYGFFANENDDGLCGELIIRVIDCEETKIIKNNYSLHSLSSL